MFVVTKFYEKIINILCSLLKFYVNIMHTYDYMNFLFIFFFLSFGQKINRKKIFLLYLSFSSFYLPLSPRIEQCFPSTDTS